MTAPPRPAARPGAVGDHAAAERTARRRRALIAKVAGLPADGAQFRARGWAVPADGRHLALEAAAGAFLTGYNTALGQDDATVTQVITAMPAGLQAFAVEGAAMGAVVDDAMPRAPGGRLAAWRARHHARHDPLIHLGAGNALVRAPALLTVLAGQLDRFWRPLIVDGWAYQTVYQDPTRMAEPPPASLRPALHPAWSQGVGRALWYVAAAVPARLGALLATFPPGVLGGLWGGIGLAAVYAGGAPPGDLAGLGATAGPHRPHLLAGAALAVWLRAREGAPLEPLEPRVQALTGGPGAAALATLAERLRPRGPGAVALCRLVAPGRSPYQQWRRRIARSLASGRMTAIADPQVLGLPPPSPSSPTPPETPP